MESLSLEQIKSMVPEEWVMRIMEEGGVMTDFSFGVAVGLLGKLLRAPEPVSGGLLHKMYHVCTNQGEYAIKQLNPDIMKRPEALQNMINSEIVAEKLKSVVPLIAAKTFEGKQIIEFEGFYYFIFDWLDGASVFGSDISEYHCGKMGEILGRIHTADIRIDNIEKLQDRRNEYNWNRLFEEAERQNAECCLIIKENLQDLMRWDRQAVNAMEQLMENRVISHRDLDPKNVMWKEGQPFVIDWEAAGYVNPYQELIEVLNYWTVDESGEYDRTKFAAVIQAYTEKVDVNDANWELVLRCSFDGMLGWLFYNLKRALGLEGTKDEDRQEGMEQVKPTLCEMKKYEKQLGQLGDWLTEYTVGK